MAKKYADLQKAEWCLASAQTFADISFYASTTQASEAAKLNIRRFSDSGCCKLNALNNAECETLAKELNEAIRPVLEKWQQRQIEVAKLMMIDISGEQDER